jgi:hypothetical protein
MRPAATAMSTASLLGRHWYSSAAHSSNGGTTGRALRSAVAAAIPPNNDAGCGDMRGVSYRQLERIPAPADASTQQHESSGEPANRPPGSALSRNHAAGIVADVLALHSLRARATPARYDPAALLRVRRAGGQDESVCQLRPMFGHLGLWLLADSPAPAPVLKLTPCAASTRVLTEVVTPRASVVSRSPHRA